MPANPSLRLEWMRRVTTDQFYISPHFHNLSHLYHNEFVDFWEFLLVVPHRG